MKGNMGKSVKKIIYIILAIVIIAILIVGGYYIFLKKGDIKNELITKDNYAKVIEQVTEELKDSDDAYYFTYACITYMSKAGLTAEYLDSQNDDLLYKEIYD